MRKLVKEKRHPKAYKRAMRIVQLNSKKKAAQIAGSEVPVIARKDLVLQWVRAVLFSIDSNCATSCLQGSFALRFFQCLNKMHTPPYRVAFMRIVRLIQQAVFREYKRIICDNALSYGSKFVSTNSDFYTNSERRQSFGCIVSNMLAQRYVLKVSFFVFCTFANSIS